MSFIAAEQDRFVNNTTSHSSSCSYRAKKTSTVPLSYAESLIELLCNYVNCSEYKNETKNIFALRLILFDIANKYEEVVKNGKERNSSMMMKFTMKKNERTQNMIFHFVKASNCERKCKKK